MLIDPIPTDSLALPEDYPFPIPRGDAQRLASSYDDDMETRTVCLFGRSMLLSLLADSLRQSPHLRVLQAEGWPEVEAHAVGAVPDVLIYDLEAGSNWHILPFLHQNPDLLLIGLDTETNRAVLVSRQATQSLTLARVQELVEAGSR